MSIHSVEVYDEKGILQVGGTGGGSSTFDVAADSGTPETVGNGDTLTLTGGTGIDTSVAATDEVTIAIDSTVATLTGSQTLTNKSLVDASTSIVDDGDATKVAKFNASGISTGTTRTFTFPDGNDVLVGTNATQTLTGKTIDGDNNTVQDLPITAIKTNGANTDRFLTRDASGVPTDATSPSFANANHTHQDSAGGGTLDGAAIAAGTVAAARLGVMTGDSGSGGASGAVPAPTTGDATKFLRGDATWQTVSGSGTTETGNFIKNASLEGWENGTTTAPDAWVLTGASATVAREATIVKHGTYSAKLTRSGTNCTLLQDIYVPGGSTFVRSRQYTFGAWVYATVASRVRLVMDDGSTVTNSSYHTGGSAWEYLTVTATLGAAITTFKVGLAVDTGNTDGYIDGCAIAEASTLAAGWYPDIRSFTEMPQRATILSNSVKITVGAAGQSSVGSSTLYIGVTAQNTPANGDTFTSSFWLKAGTYTLSILGNTNTNLGIVDYYIDNVLVLASQDWYSGVSTANVVKSGSVTVTYDGYHVLKAVVNGKNASSTNYFWSFGVIDLYPSAD